MVNTYLSIGSAIYGGKKKLGKEKIMSVSVVGVRSKEDITLESTDKRPVVIDSPESVRAAFDWLLQTTIETVRHQIHTDRCLSVPVVFGIPATFPAEVLNISLRKAYEDVLGRRKDKSPKVRLKPRPPQASMALRKFLSGSGGGYTGGWKPSVKKASDGPAPEDSNAHDLDQKQIELLMDKACQRALGGDRPYISHHPRLFDPIHHGIFHSDDPVDQAEAAAKVLDVEEMQRLQDLHDKAKAGDMDALEKLRHHARKYAENLALGYKSLINTTTQPLSRFVLLAPRKPPYLNNPSFNFVRWFDLRDVFGQEFMMQLGLDHPVTIKGPDDIPSPAFGDVAATYGRQTKALHETGNQHVREVVFIKHPEDDMRTNPACGG